MRYVQSLRFPSNAGWNARYEVSQYIVEFAFLKIIRMIEQDEETLDGHETEEEAEVSASKTKTEANPQVHEDCQVSDCEPKCSWLHEELARYHIHQEHIESCEDILIVREGFTSKEIFSRVPTSKMTYGYLESIEITPLGVQGVLIVIHKKLNEEICDEDIARIPSPAVKWLRSKLHASHALPHLQKECEWKLVVQEGITSKDLFASLPENVFNVGYLKKIGITALGLQQVLLEWHYELHHKYIQQLNCMVRSNHVLIGNIPAKEGGRDQDTASIRNEPTRKRARTSEQNP